MASNDAQTPATTTASSLGGDFQLVVPPRPAGQADMVLSQAAATGETRRQLIAMDLLPPDKKQQVQKVAADLLPKMLQNTEIFMNFGEDAVAGMNALIDRMLKEVTPVDIPELESRMRDLSDEMRKIRGKYDVSDPKTRAKLEEWSKGVRRFFGRTRSLIEVLMEDVMSLEQQLDRVKGFLAGKEQQLVRNVHLYDELYATNEQEIKNVIATIAVMEAIHDQAAAMAGEIHVDVNDPSQRDAAERKRMLSEFVNNMEIKITEYKNRLFVGWTTSPQVTNMRTLDVGLAQKIHLLIDLAIPTMKGTILQWRMLIQAGQGADMERVVAQSVNEWLTAYAAAGAEAVPRIAEAVQTPTLTPQSIAAMADSIDQQATSIIEAYENGKARRAEVDDAIVAAQRVIQSATARVSDTVVNDLVAKAHIVPPEQVPATTSPAP